MSKTIVITGVSRGLGLSLVNGFIEAGHRVAGCARTEPAVEGLRARHPPPHLFHPVNVASDAEVRQWAVATIEALGAPDLLINNAALINRSAPLWEVPAEEFSELIDVNIKGVTSVIRHFLPAMRVRGAGVIVNLSSGWGRSTSPDVAPYCASKWAVEGLTRALAQEIPSGMAAIPLNPGVINTEMLQSCFGAGAASYPSAEEWGRRAVPFILGLGVANNGEPLTVP